MNKLNKIAYGHIIKTLLVGPSNPHELAEASGMHIRSMQLLMNTWKRMKVVHIKAWDPDAMGRDQIPVFALGEGRNARRRKLTAAERSKRSRDKKKLNEITKLTTGGEQHDIRASRPDVSAVRKQ